jgi:hypothetical protein
MFKRVYTSSCNDSALPTSYSTAAQAGVGFALNLRHDLELPGCAGRPAETAHPKAIIEACAGFGSH